MPRVLNRPAATRPPRTPAEQLRATMAALRVSFMWFGIRKTLTRSAAIEARSCSAGVREGRLAAGRLRTRGMIGLQMNDVKLKRH